MKTKRDLLILQFMFLTTSCSVLPLPSDSSSSSMPLSSSGWILADGAGEYIGDPTFVETQGIDNPVTWAYKGKTTAEPLYFALFDHSSDVRFEIKADDDVWQLMEKYQTDKRLPGHSSKYFDLYFPCQVIVALEDRVFLYEDVGIRLRGNNCRDSFFDLETGRLVAPSSFKLSFKATFDDEAYDDLPAFSKYKVDWTGKEQERALRKDRNFVGLEKMDFKITPRNQFEDYACDAQGVFCSDTFNENGLLAAKSNIVDVGLRGDGRSCRSSYELLEPIDKQFLKKRFSKSDAKGDLYKCTWSTTGRACLQKDRAVYDDVDACGKACGKRIPKGSIGVEDNYNGYNPTYDLKTNDDGEDSDFSKIVELINILDDCVSQKTGKDELEAKVNISYWLAFSALNELLGTADDMRYNGNNFYLYFCPSDGKAYFIPYDFDWSLGCFPNRNDVRDNVGIWSRNGIYGDQYATLVLATIVEDSNISYDNHQYRQIYSDYCYRFLKTAGVLDFARYDSLSNELLYANGNCKDSVESYMVRRAVAVEASCI